MTHEPKHVVYDCNVLLGAMLSTKGAAAARRLRLNRRDPLRRVASDQLVDVG